MSDDRDDERNARDPRRSDREAPDECADMVRDADAYARARDRDAEELARLKVEMAEERKREEDELAREAKELDREVREIERMTSRVEREQERAVEERVAERWARHGDGDEPGAGGDEHAGGDERGGDERGGDERGGDERGGDERGGHDHGHHHPHREHEWARVERAWRRYAEQRGRWEQRRAEHRKRWKHKRRRWKELHEERDMWMKMRKDKRGWGPWWLQARMRRRIFSWLAFAFVSGAITMSYWDASRWWHAVLALIGLSVMSGIISFRLTRPLIMVIRVAQDIGDGKLETRLDVDRHRGETRLLAIAINEMAERIEQQLKDQRELLAAVSHELRTPLGHMRVLIDTARDSGDRKALGELEREVLVLDDLVGRLLASSRLEFGNLDCRVLDLGALVSDVATAAGVAPEAIEAIGDVRATIDPTLVRRAVANLLDNARIHGGGAVAVRIERRARQVAIEVDDAGPGVPADRRADAFRAFVPSRAGGLGLGLALVSRIAVAHNGGAWITDRPGGGARVGFTVEIAPSGPRAA
jgi:signal transduction histidine kinase